MDMYIYIALATPNKHIAVFSVDIGLVKNFAETMLPPHDAIGNINKRKPVNGALTAVVLVPLYIAYPLYMRNRNH